MLFQKNIFASFLTFVLATSAYKIDGSCRTKGIESDVQTAMTNAFEMVNSALSHIDQPVYDQDTRDLIKRVFNPKNFEDTNSKLSLIKVRRVYQDIRNNYQSEITGDVPVNDVVSRLLQCSEIQELTAS
jgi:hypothetical protein